jgi:hypothetical protein
MALADVGEPVVDEGSATSSIEGETTMQAKNRALKILAKSIYRELRHNGYEPREIVALSTEILGLITTDIRPEASETATGLDK